MRRIHSYSCMIWPTSYVLRTILHILWMCAAYMKAFYLYLLPIDPLYALLHNAGLWGAYISIPPCTCQSAMYSEQYSTFCSCAQCKYPRFYIYLLSHGLLCAHLHKGEYERYTILSFHTQHNQLFIQKNIVHSMDAHIVNTYNSPSLISWFNLCAQVRIMKVHVPVITLTEH